MIRKINFYSGPSAIPKEVLQQATENFFDYEKQGFSIAEISHRSSTVKNILEEFHEKIRSLFMLSNEHEVLIVQGGARLQFAQIPMNFLSKEKTAGFIDTGYWAHKAMEYASYYGQTKIIAGSKNNNYSYIPKELFIPQKLNYLQITSNNTIYGTQYKQLPNIDSPLVVDMSSDILSIKRDFSKIDFAFACAQKNIGPSGMSVVIVKKEFLKKSNSNIPPIFNYQNLIQHQSNYSTPPVLSIYIGLLNLRWLHSMGGIQQIEIINNQKSKILYEEIERNSMFQNNIREEDRSNMNVCFFAKDKKIEQSFLNFCHQQNIIGIEGHKESGGLRASLYNAVPMEHVFILIQCMKDFEQAYQ